MSSVCVESCATCCGNDFGIKSDTPRDVDARRRARHAEPQRIGRRQRLLIEAHRRIQHALYVAPHKPSATCDAWR